MEEKQKYKIAIEYKDFQEKILDYITSGKLDEMINHTVFNEDENCKSAIIHGMCIASLVASSCDQIYVMEME